MLRKLWHRPLWTGSMIACAALGLALAGCSGGDSGGAANSSGGQTAASSGGDSSGTGTLPVSGGGGAGKMSGMAGGMMSGGGGPMGGGMGGGAAQVAATPVPKNTAPAPGYRQDPLKPWWDTSPKPPPVLSLVTPVRLAAANTAQQEKPEGVEIQEVPNRRVAGILTGNGIYALIDDFGGGATVAKPGTVLPDGYVVSTIKSDSVVLKKKVDNRTYTQVVPLTDAGSSATRFSAPGAGAPGGPGLQMPGRLGGGTGRKGLGIPGGGGGAAE